MAWGGLHGYVHLVECAGAIPSIASNAMLEVERQDRVARQERRKQEGTSSRQQHSRPPTPQPASPPAVSLRRCTRGSADRRWATAPAWAAAGRRRCALQGTRVGARQGGAGQGQHLTGRAVRGCPKACRKLFGPPPLCIAALGCCTCRRTIPVSTHAHCTEAPLLITSSSSQLPSHTPHQTLPLARPPPRPTAPCSHPRRRA